MFTVIIAEKEYIDKVKEYQLFLKPFMDRKKVAFCQWYPEYDRLADMVPTLAEEVGRRLEWRAVIICNEKGINQRNPFDLVTHLPSKYSGAKPGDPEGENEADEYEEYLQSEHKNKLLAYEEATSNPMTKLVTFMCESPTVTKVQLSSNEDAGYVRYITENSRKQELRKSILGSEIIETAMPCEILCVAKRTAGICAEEFDTVWSSHTETEYSNFCDRNMYFDKMRFMVFDILPRTQRNYAFDYVRFLYATILLASNDIPSGCLNPARVYSIQCKNDEDALCDLLYAYEAKLDATKNLLEQRINKLNQEKARRLTDREAEQIFCAKVTVPVAIDNEFDKSELYVSTNGIGLSNGCPSSEEGVWDTRYTKSKKTLHRLLKQTHRSLRHAAKDAHTFDYIDVDRVGLLNEFQLDDVKEHIDNEELAMVATHTPDLYNEEAFAERMEEGSDNVKRKIKKRMQKLATVAVGAVGILAYILGFVTMFFRNSDSNAFNWTATGIIVLSALGAICAIAFVTLFFLRGALIKRFKGYNRVMSDIDGDIKMALNEYSHYLSHMCNVRRGFLVLNTAHSKENPNTEKVTLYTKHIIDIEAAKAELKEVFGHYMTEESDIDITEVAEYDFNFDRPCEYVYPLPYSAGDAKTITFIQPGITTEIPVSFVESIVVRREELYD